MSPAPQPIQAPGASPADRVRQAQRPARAELGRRETLQVFLRDLLGETDPEPVADVVIDRLASWIPLGGWAVFMADGLNEAVLVGNRGVPDTLAASVHGVGVWVMREGSQFYSGDLAHDERIPGSATATAVGLPLVCRGVVVGAVVGTDPSPSPRPPQFAAGVLRLLVHVLDAAAYGLDHALKLQRAEAMSITDDLTGLYNSRYLKEALHREAKRAVRYGRSLAVLFIDLDGFKTVNDTHGHLAGSQTLVEVGAVIRSCAPRESDIVARYGGDEFVVVLPDTDTQGGMVVAQRIRDRIAQHAFLVPLGLHLSASLGVAVLPDAGKTAEDLVNAADRAMYRVKESGKNNIRLADH